MTNYRATDEYNETHDFQESDNVSALAFAEDFWIIDADIVHLINMDDGEILF